LYTRKVESSMNWRNRSLALALPGRALSIVRPLVLLPLIVTLAGCLSMDAPERGYSLYPQPANRPPLAEVARLKSSLPLGTYPADAATIIEAVDGREVSKLDSYFEVQPGCHVVRTATRLLNSSITNSKRSGRIYPIEPRLFALRMRKGFEYTIVLRYGPQMGQSIGGTSLSVYAVESDQRGNQSHPIQPISIKEASFCRLSDPPPS
jgi:hypothetical protein